MTVDLLGTPHDVLADHLDRWGVGARHAGRVFRGLHRHRIPLHDIADLGRHADTIATHTHRVTARVLATHDSPDRTVRLVLGLPDGSRVESVLVPMRHGRRTLCVSSQVGCAMGCTFCATGTLGLTRDLTAGEIVAQVHAARDVAEARGEDVQRLVFMGMGEPLHAYDSVADALRVLLDDHGWNLGTRRVVVSTVGLIGRLRRFATDFEGKVGLALSLHAGTDATRRRIVPVARRTSLAELKAALLDHPFPKGRPLMLEVVVLPGVNDGEADLDGIAAFADGLPAIVNLIPFNPFPGTDHRTPTEAEITAMHRGLVARGCQASVRTPKGRDEAGACGQLALRTGRDGAPAQATSR